MQRPNVMQVCGVVVFGLVVLMAVAFAQADFVSQVLSDNPLGYWQLNESSGATAANQGSTEAAGNATYTNFSAGEYAVAAGPLTGSGNNVAAAGFNGTLTGGIANYVNIPQAAISSIGTGAYSMEMWFNCPTASADPAKCLLTFQNSTNENTGVWVQDNSIGFYFNCLGENKFAWSCVANSQWYDLVLSRDASSNVTAYLNGTQILSVSGVTDDVGGGTNSRNKIGAGNDFWYDTLSNPFDGQIGQVAIYGSAMSQETALAHYNAGITDRKSVV